jgi:hypothetical protein
MGVSQDRGRSVASLHRVPRITILRHVFLVLRRHPGRIRLAWHTARAAARPTIGLVFEAGRTPRAAPEAIALSGPQP